MRIINHKRPTVTVFTDASWTEGKEGNAAVAGWGGWAFGNGRSSYQTGGRATYYKPNQFIELDGLRKMLRELLETRYLTSSDTHIMVQGDSTQALSMLVATCSNAIESRHRDGARLDRLKSPKGHLKDPCVNDLMMDIQGMLLPLEIVYVRHVRAHRRDDASRHSVNNYCDKRAKKEYSKAVKEARLDNNRA